MSRRGVAWLIVGVAAVLGGGIGRVGLPTLWAASAPSWMRVDAAHKRVSFTVTAADGGANGTLNFNGYASGKLTVTVPAGWHVHIDFVNSGAGALPHSLEVITATSKVPPQGIRPAIAGAETRDLIAGVPPQQTDTVEFTAAPAGRYLWFCGVPSHGISGMWDGFVVSATAKLPGVTVK